MTKGFKLNESTNVAMPIRNLISIIAAVAIGVWAFFGIQETLNRHATQLEIMDKDLTLNTEFRIGWPRGLLGSLPADSEQFMLIEELYITALSKAVEKLQSDVEKLKDKQRSFANGNHN